MYYMQNSSNSVVDELYVKKKGSLAAYWRVPASIQAICNYS